MFNESPATEEFLIRNKHTKLHDQHVFLSHSTVALAQL